MDAYYFTFRSITAAQTGAACLERVGIRHVLLRTPRSMAKQGCGYSLQVMPSGWTQVAALFRQEGIAFQRLFYLTQGQMPVEVSV